MSGSQADERPKVAYQGELGAYSEQAVFELLGRHNVNAVPFQSFDAAFAAATAGEVTMVMVPIENSLGGTVHANFDLQLRHNLFIIGEHDFRVRHFLMALPGTKMEQVKKIISHHQALSQCDTYIRRKGVASEQAYDTAGSAKMIAERKLEGVAAICGELCADHYGLEIVDRNIEDDSNNFTRFLLLRRDPLRIPQGVECKTSICFSLENVAGALFKALSVFALRDIDLSKIESRPCKPDIMDKLERMFWSMGGTSSLNQRTRGWALGAPPESPRKQPEERLINRSRYRYLFYVDILAPLDDPNSANAIRHLQEITTFLRILGCYPRGGTLLGPGHLLPRPSSSGMLGAEGGTRRWRLGIIGFGTFGQFMAKKLVLNYDVVATSRHSTASPEAKKMGATWTDTLDEFVDSELDIIIVAVSVLSFEKVLRKVSTAIKTRGTSTKALIVDVCSVKVHPKTTMLAALPETCDILCTHPMFGPESGKAGWTGLPFVFERVRLNDSQRCESFLQWWAEQGCRMVDMSCELHDECAAGSQFVTHFTGRALSRLDLRTTPINTKGFESLLQLVDNTCKDSFDLFYALYKHNPNSERQLKCIEDAVTELSSELRSLAAGKGSEEAA